jgi:hypothetical protein
VKLFFAATAAVLLAGCGGASGHRGRTVTLSSYAGFPATTIVRPYSASACASDSRAFAREAVLFANHVGPAAAYSADTYYLDLRRVFADFEARGCEPAALGAALEARLTTTQRRLLVANLPREMARSVAQSMVRR